MNEKDQPKKMTSAEKFAEEAAGRQNSILAEFTEFLLTNKKWWLTPIILVLLLLGAAVMLAGTGAAPFIYTLF